MAAYCARSAIGERRCGELHVVGPVRLFVEVGRVARRGLADPWVGTAELVRGACLVGEERGEGGIAPREETGAERERRRELAGGRRKAGGPVLVAEQPLRPTCALIHGPRAPSAPPVVRRIGGRQVEEGVVAVVGDLVEQHGVAGRHAHEPLQPVARLVQHVGAAVAPGPTVGLEPIGEGAGMIAIRHQEVGRRGGRRGHVLQVVGGIGPPAAHVHRVARTRRIDDDAVAPVHRIAEHRVPSGPLLAHVVEQGIGTAVVDMRADPERGRSHAVRLHLVAAASAQRGEVEPIGLDTWPEAGRGARPLAIEPHDAARVDHAERGERDRRQRTGHRDLRTIGQIADLVDAQEQCAVARGCRTLQRHEHEQGEDHASHSGRW
jgi:hypothetical protein